MSKKSLLGKIIVILLIAVFFLNVTILNGSASEPLIGEDDSYTKKIQIESSDTFNWTVYKNGSVDYVVTVSAKGLEAWNQKIKSSYFVLDEDNPYQIVGLSVTIPPFPDRDFREATVSFVFRPINQTDSFEKTKNVSVFVTGKFQAAGDNLILGIFENPLPHPLNNTFGAFILNVVLWAGIAILVYAFIKRILIQVAKKTKTMLDDALIEIIRFPILIIIIMYGAVQSIFELDINLGLRASITQVTYFLYAVIGIYMAYRIFIEILDEITKIKGGRTSIFGAVLRPVFRKIGITVILIGGSIFALNALGIQVTALLAGAGVMGLVIAFAAQDTLSNFFSGIHLLLDRPFKIGDIIFLEGGEYCRVEAVGMRSTKLYSIFDHELIILPNNAVANQKIINIVKPDARIRKKISVGVAYGSDLEKVQYIMYQSAKQHPHVVDEPGYEPQVRFDKFGDSSLDFIMYVWIDEVLNQWEVMSDIRLEIDTRFRKDKITIPFPQRTVWLNQVQRDEKKAKTIKHHRQNKKDVAENKNKKNSKK